MISPTENVSCSLPNRGSGRKEHTHDRSLICGGTPGAEGRVGMSAQKSTMRSSCLNLTSSATHILTHMRSRHSSWPVDSGTILMGGTPQDFSIRDSLYTTELVKFDGTKEEAFGLKYSTTMYDVNTFRYYKSFKGYNIYFSDACSIPDGDSVLLTGGICYWGSDYCTCTCDSALIMGLSL